MTRYFLILVVFIFLFIPPLYWENENLRGIFIWETTTTWVMLVESPQNQQQEVLVNDTPIIENPLLEENTWSWIIEPPQWGQLVRIVEIFPKDTTLYGEYLVLSFSHFFSGDIRLVGVGNWSAEKIISLHTEAWALVYIIDTLGKTQPSPNQQSLLLSSITLTDTWEPLEVWIWNELQDKTIYSTSSSTQALWCGEEKNAEGFRLCDSFIPPSLGSSPNTPPWSWDATVTWNTTTTWTTTVTWSTTTWESVISWNNNITTGNTTVSWETLSTGNEQMKNSLARFEEIYPYDELFPEYVEIITYEKYTWPLIIQWLGQWSADKSFFLDTLPGMRRIITDDPTKFASYPFVIWLSSLSLTNDGEQLSIIGQYWEEIDSIVYSWQQETKSLVFQENNTPWSWQTRWFFLTEPPTPWFTLGMITHLLPETKPPPRCGIHRQHTTPLFSDKKLNVQALVNDEFLQNSQTNYFCEWIFSGWDLVYMSWCNPSYLSFEPGIWPVTLRISKDTTPLCEISEQLNLPAPLSSSQETTPISYYEGLYRKRKEKYESLATTIRSFWFTITAAGELHWDIKKESAPTLPEWLLMSWLWPPKIQIHLVMPNPKGKDALGERLVIENLTEESILSDDLMLVKGKSSKWLPPWISFAPGEQTEIVGDLWLPNSPTCIALRYRKSQEPLALFCYPQLKEDESYTWGMVWFDSSEEQQRLQELSLVLNNDQACVSLWWQEVMCKGLPYPISEAKQRKKDAKKLVSLTKKVTTLWEKYTLRREKYATLSKNNKKREAKLTQRNRELRDEVRLQKKQKNAFRSMYRLLKKKLWEERAPLSSSPTIQHLNFLYDELILPWDADILQLWPVSLPIDEIDTRYELYFEGKLPYTYISTPDVVSYLSGGFTQLGGLLGGLFISPEVREE